MIKLKKDKTLTKRKIKKSKLKKLNLKHQKHQKPQGLEFIFQGRREK